MLKKQQEEEEEKQAQIIQASEQEALEKFKCEICHELLTENAVIPLDKCEHVFHSECLA